MTTENDNLVEIENENNNDTKKHTGGDSKSADAAATEKVKGEGKDRKRKESKSDFDAASYAEQLLRAQAELQNYKRRTEQRMQQWRESATRDILQKLLPVVDDFDILFEHHQDENETISVQGVKMIYNKLMSALKDLGLTPIEAVGQQFDPNVHEAVMAEESRDCEDGQILKVWQRGFTYNDSLMRPAKVITAKAVRQSGDENE